MFQLFIDKQFINWSIPPLVFLLNILFSVDQRLHHLNILSSTLFNTSIECVEVCHNDFEVRLVLALVVYVDFVIDYIQKMAFKGRELCCWNGHCILKVAVFIETEVLLVYKSILLIVFRCKGHTCSKQTMREMRLVFVLTCSSWSSIAWQLCWPSGSVTAGTSHSSWLGSAPGR